MKGRERENKRCEALASGDSDTEIETRGRDPERRRCGDGQCFPKDTINAHTWGWEGATLWGREGKDQERDDKSEYVEEA